jgi:enolase
VAYKISDIRAREIIDCRGFPTVEVDVWVNGELCGRADVPSGRSTGKREAIELRDGGKRWGGQGTTIAVRNVHTMIRPALIGWDPRDQRAIDARLCELDGTGNKSKLGSNATTGVSLGVARAAANVCDQPFYKYINDNAYVIPVPLVNLINGGKLTSNDLEIQEFIVIPVGAKDLKHGLQICYEINILLRNLIIDRHGKIAVNVGDEGGYAPPLTGINEPMEILSKAVKASGHADMIVYGMDAAASHWYDWDKGVYRMEGEEMTRDDVIDMYVKLCRDYPVSSIEDPLMEDDFEGHTILTEKLDDVQIVGLNLKPEMPSCGNSIRLAR